MSHSSLKVSKNFQGRDFPNGSRPGPDSDKINIEINITSNELENVTCRCNTFTIDILASL